MASIENSLKHEAEVEPGKVRLVTSGEFVRAYNHSAWLFYCCVSKYKERGTVRAGHGVAKCKSPAATWTVVVQ